MRALTSWTIIAPAPAWLLFAAALFGLKRGIDLGLMVGPRIWPVGAMISQTGGHGDFLAAE